jgi:hypothetical protein
MGPAIGFMASGKHAHEFGNLEALKAPEVVSGASRASRAPNPSACFHDGVLKAVHKLTHKSLQLKFG